MSRSGWLVVIGGGLLLVLVLASSLINPFVWGRGPGGYGYGWGMMGRGMMGGFGFPVMGMMGLGMLVFWVLIIGGVIWLVRSLARSSGSSSIPRQGESPFEILQKRYSQGEITKEQFEGMKRDIGL